VLFVAAAGVLVVRDGWNLPRQVAERLSPDGGGAAPARRPDRPGADQDGAGSAPGATAAPRPVLAAGSAAAPLPSAAGLSAALAAPLADPALGSRVSLTIAAAGSGQVLLDRGGTRWVTPASTAKLPTAVAALSALGSHTRLVTRVVTGTEPGEVVLVGGGDPTVAGPAPGPGYPRAARLADLAAAARRAGATSVRRVTVDAGRWTGPATEPSWSPSYVLGGNVAPISAVTIDGGRLRPGGRARSPEPDLAAGRALAGLLGAPSAQVVQGRAPAGARELARVESPPVSALTETMLLASDNVLAEALARHVATARGEPASFTGAARAVRAELAELGLDPAGLRLVDGSGLSRRNALQPAALVDLLTVAASPQHPELHAVFAGLPVAGYLGTLAERFTVAPAAAGAGVVRAKTGTLNGVSTLAGTVRTADGRLLAFAVAADRLPGASTRRAERALDRLVATLARCGCR